LTTAFFYTTSTRNMNKFIQDFKEFAVKGNLIDLAIGIIIGTAFNAIVNSLVKDIIMPPFGLIFGDQDLSNYKWVLQAAETNEAGEVITPEVAMLYGNFLQVSIDFLIIALSIFVIIRVFNRLQRQAEDEQEPKVPTPKNIQLLAEIRDLLKEQQKR